MTKQELPCTSGSRITQFTRRSSGTCRPIDHCNNGTVAHPDDHSRLAVVRAWWWHTKMGQRQRVVEMVGCGRTDSRRTRDEKKWYVMTVTLIAAETEPKQSREGAPH